jgi:hypothetical protein
MNKVLGVFIYLGLLISFSATGVFAEQIDPAGVSGWMGDTQGAVSSTMFQWEEYGDDGSKSFSLREGPFTYDQLELSDMNGLMKFDPVIEYSLIVTNNNQIDSKQFSFTFFTPIMTIPAAAQTYVRSGVHLSSLSADADVSALDPAGVPMDGDGISEIHVATAKNFFGGFLENLGVDIIESVPPELIDYETPWAFGPTGQDWNWLQVDVNFELSPGATFRLDGWAEITDQVPTGNNVPLPTAVWMLGPALLGLAGLRRRFRN